MSIFEYDQEKHIKLERKQAWKEGREAGIAEGRAAGIAEGREAGIAEGREAGITEGKAAGKAEGEKLMLTKLIQKKLLRGKTPAQIAEELEEERPVIEDIIKKYF